MAFRLPNESVPVACRTRRIATVRAQLIRRAAWALLVAAPLHAAAEGGAPAVSGDAAAERRMWQQRLAWPASLCPAASPRPDAAGVAVHAIDAETAWVVVACRDFAYQGTQLVYLRSRGRAVLLSFTQFDAAKPGAPKPYRSSLLLGSVDADAAQGRLQVLRVYRGLGDCGQWLSYAARTAPPRLMELRIRECGDGPGAGVPPGQWPLRRP